MKTITIVISVPDGVDVQVGGARANGGGRQDRPFVERPAPPEPIDVECPVCGNDEWRLVPSGISKKTGKRYNSFWACTTPQCDGRPPRGSQQDSSYLVDVTDESGFPF